MTLGDKQRKFIKDFCLLIQYAYALGYEVTFQPEHENHIENSLHFKGLAKDINLFYKGKYLRETSEYIKLGEFWEILGNSWGGRFQDGNHFSIEYNGIR